MLKAPYRRLISIACAVTTLFASSSGFAQPLVDQAFAALRDGGAPERPNEQTPTSISEADLRVIAARMDESRAALRQKDPAGAIRLLTKILKYPENKYSAEALELLGVARQKNGQLEEAKAAYGEYLHRYPSGDASERVRQRLAGIVTASSEMDVLLHAPSGDQPGALPTDRFTQSHETTWTLVGSASEFYIRDDSFNTVRDPATAPNPNADPDAYRVHQNEMMSNLDLTATWNNDQTRGKIRFSGSEEHMFGPSGDLLGVAALSVDTLIKDLDLRSVIGRQSANTDGVLGRFDGALLSWQPLTMLRLDVVAGSPAVSRFDTPFKNDQYFYGAGIGFGPFNGFDTTIYAIEQRDRWLVDREAVGVDFRYFDPTKSAFGTIDYDTHFQQLNAAVVSGSWTLPDNSTIYGGADYRRTPYLSATNALLNQPFATLYDLLKAQYNAPVTQLALNQTPVYKSAMIGFSHPLTDKLQVSADATVVNLTQPITPIGVDPALAPLASLPAGNEYYYTAQLIANNIVKDGDMYIAALHYSQLATSTDYVLDFNTRFSLFNDWRIGPRLRLGYMRDNGGGLTEYTVLPSILLDYYLNKELSFEAEIGVQWTSSIQTGIRTNDTELMATIGIRYDFYSDNSTRSDAPKATPSTPAAAALCRYAAYPGSGSCAPSSPIIGR